MSGNPPMINLLPIPSMYGIFSYSWLIKLICMTNTGKFTINIPYMDAMGNIHSLTMGIYHKVRLGWEFKPEKLHPRSCGHRVSS